MARRGHGEGSIYRRKDGRWAASIALEGRKRRTFYGKTRKEVQDKLNEALHQKKTGALVTGPRQTVRQYLTYWLEEVHKLEVRISTFVDQRGLVHNHILPVLGSVQLQKLAPHQVQTLYTSKLEEGLSAGRIRIMLGW